MASADWLVQKMKLALKNFVSNLISIFLKKYLNAKLKERNEIVHQVVRSSAKWKLLKKLSTCWNDLTGIHSGSHSNAIRCFAFAAKGPRMSVDFNEMQMKTEPGDIWVKIFYENFIVSRCAFFKKFGNKRTNHQKFFKKSSDRCRFFEQFHKKFFSIFLDFGRVGAN